jgi:carnitine O-palmitoyltransferase 2
MYQYSKLFGTSRIPRKDKDELVTSTTSTHIVVLHRNNFYKVDVRTSDGAIKPVEEIFAQLVAIVTDNSGPGIPVGILTTENRDTWAAARETLLQNPQNRATLQTIDSALFAVSLDDVSTTSEEELAHLFLHGQGLNRWFDKSFSLIVTKNGKASVNFEHSWGDGVAVLRYVNEIVKDSNQRPVQLPKSATGKTQKLNWSISESIQSAIDSAEKRIKKQASALEFKTTPFRDFGKNFFKAHQISPDGAVQMSYQLAYHRMYSKVVSTYESASTAAFRHGRTETIRPVSSHSVEMCKAFESSSTDVETKAALLRKAVQYHSQQVKDCATGQGIDRHLFAMMYYAKKKGIDLPDIYKDKAYALLNHNTLSTSTLVSEAIEGGGFGPVVADGYGIGYGVESDQMRFNITSYLGNTQQFTAHILESLKQIQNVLSKSKPVQPTKVK